MKNNKKSIWYLFKENFFNAFKNKIQLFSLLILNLILTIVLTVAWTTISNLDDSIRYMNSNDINISTSYFFETKSRARLSNSDMVPHFALTSSLNSVNRTFRWKTNSTNKLEKIKTSWKNNYGSLKIASSDTSNDGVLLPFTTDNIEIITNNNLITAVKFAPGWLSWKRINKNYVDFETSLLGQLLKYKTNENNPQFQSLYFKYQIELEKFFDSYFQKLLTAIYEKNNVKWNLNNSSQINELKIKMLTKINMANPHDYWIQNFDNDIDLLNNKEVPLISTNGSLNLTGNIAEQDFIEYYRRFNNNTTNAKKLYNQKNIIHNGLKGNLILTTFDLDKKSEGSITESIVSPDIARTSLNRLEKDKLINLFQIYNQILGWVNNFKTYAKSEYLFSNSNTNITYRVINNDHFSNEPTNKLKIIQGKAPEAFNQIVVNPQFAKQHNYYVGDKIKVSNLELTITGIGGDGWTILPIVNEFSFIPNPAKEAILYVTNDLFYSKQLVNDNDVEERSQVYFQYYGDNLKIDQNKLKLYLGQFFTDNNKNYNNLINELNILMNNNELNEESSEAILNKLSTTMPLSNEKNTNFNNRGFNALKSTRNSYILISTIITIFIIIITIFVVILMIKKIIEKQSVDMGILKALGYNNSKIVISFWAYPLIITFITVPLGWFIGLALQYLIMGVFNNLFILQYNIFSFNLWPLLLAFNLILFITILSCSIGSYMQINKPVLSLLYPYVETKSANWILKIYHKLFHSVRFRSRFKLILLSVSIRKMMMMLLTIFLSTFIISISLVIPATVNTLERSYYTNIKNKTEISYNSPIANLPLSRYSLYAWDGINAEKNLNSNYPVNESKPTPDYVYSESESKWVKMTDYYQDINISELLTQFANNIYWIGGKALSLGWIENFSNQFKNSKSNDFLTTIVCRVLNDVVAGSGENSKINENGDWKSCVEDVISSNLPIYVKETLKDPVKKKRFAFSYNSLAYNASEDELFTKYYSNFNNNSKFDTEIETYGIKKNSKMILFDQKTNKQLTEKQPGEPYPIAINQSAYLQYGFYENQNFKSYVKNKVLKYLNKSQIMTTIPKTWWKYEDSAENPFEMEMDKWTIAKPLTYGYIDNYSLNKPIKEFKNLNRIILELPKNMINSEWNVEIASNANKIYTQLDNKYVIEDKGDRWLIRPFIPFKTSDNKIVTKKFYDSPLNILASDKYRATNFFNYYFNFNGKNNLTFGEDINTIEYKVIAIHNSYDEPKIYINHNYANEINDFNQKKFSDHYQVNPFNNELMWFNGSYSINNEAQDLVSRVSLSTKNHVYDLENLTVNVPKNSVENIELLSVKQELIKKLITLTSSIAAIFIILAIGIAVIIIIMITNFLVQQFNKIMAIMKVQGYNNYEISNSILSIFLIPIIIGFTIGFVTSWLTAKLIIYLISQSIGLIIPLWFTWWTLPIVLGLILIICSLTYLVSNHFLRKMNVLQLITANDQ